MTAFVKEVNAVKEIKKQLKQEAHAMNKSVAVFGASSEDVESRIFYLIFSRIICWSRGYLYHISLRLNWINVKIKSIVIQIQY